VRNATDTIMSRRWLAVLAGVSGVATAVVLAGGNSPSDALLAARAALKNPPVTYRIPTETVTTPVTVTTNSSSSNPGKKSTTKKKSSPKKHTTTTTTTSTTPSTTTTTPTNAGLPKVKHVFLIALSTPSYQTLFGKKVTTDPYLQALSKKGALLAGYKTLGAGELADEIAMLSGQPPNKDTTAGCPTYKAFPASAAPNTKTGVVPGNGCVYPDAAVSLADETESNRGDWAAYIDELGASACPTPNANASMADEQPGTRPAYDPFHNPFIFFGSLEDDGGCFENDLGLSALPHALSRKDDTPTLAYIAPDACADGDPTIVPASSSTTTSSSTVTTDTSTTPAAQPVGCPAGDTNGLPAEDAFLKTWVPKIQKSPAYKQGGVIVITFSGTGHTATATGTLVLSQWTKPRIRTAKFTPYSLLRSVEQMLGYGYLGYAADASSFAHLVL
jgi:phosphatidylinositol-3-phosphatase